MDQPIQFNLAFRPRSHPRAQEAAVEALPSPSKLIPRTEHSVSTLKYRIAVDFGSTKYCVALDRVRRTTEGMSKEFPQYVEFDTKVHVKSDCVPKLAYNTMSGIDLLLGSELQREKLNPMFDHSKVIRHPKLALLEVGSEEMMEMSNRCTKTINHSFQALSQGGTLHVSNVEKLIEQIACKLGQAAMARMLREMLYDPSCDPTELVLGFSSAWSLLEIEDLKACFGIGFVQAGFTDLTIKVVDEGAAAATSLLRNSIRAEALLRNDLFMVVDAGGATVDVFTGRVLDKYEGRGIAIEQVVPPQAGCYGSITLHGGLLAYLESSTPSEIKEDLGSEWNTLLRQADEGFEIAKKFFMGRDPDAKTPIYCKILSTSARFLKYEGSQNPAWSMHKGHIWINNDKILSIFEKSIRGICDMIKEQWNACMRAGNMKNIFLLGGYSASTYLRARLVSEFRDVLVVGALDSYKAEVLVAGGCIADADLPTVYRDPVWRVNVGVRLNNELEVVFAKGTSACQAMILRIAQRAYVDASEPYYQLVTDILSWHSPRYKGVWAETQKRLTLNHSLESHRIFEYQQKPRDLTIHYWVVIEHSEGLTTARIAVPRRGELPRGDENSIRVIDDKPQGGGNWKENVIVWGDALTLDRDNLIQAAGDGTGVTSADWYNNDEKDAGAEDEVTMASN